jgi:ABC-type Fe3+ transport system permease subunit
VWIAAISSSVFKLIQQGHEPGTASAVGVIAGLIGLAFLAGLRRLIQRLKSKPAAINSPVEPKLATPERARIEPRERAVLMICATAIICALIYLSAQILPLLLTNQPRHAEIIDSNGVIFLIDHEKGKVWRYYRNTDEKGNPVREGWTPLGGME